MLPLPVCFSISFSLSLSLSLSSFISVAVVDYSAYHSLSLASSLLTHSLSILHFPLRYTSIPIYIHLSFFSIHSAKPLTTESSYHNSLSLYCSLQGICQSLLSCSLLLFPSYLFIIMHKYIDSQRRLLVSAKVQPETASSPLRLSPHPLHLVHLMAEERRSKGRGSCKEFHATLCHPVCCLCNKANCCNPFCKAHQLLLLLLAARCLLLAACCMGHASPSCSFALRCLLSNEMDFY